MTLSLIAAIADNNCIGIKNKLPWNIPEDLQRFKNLTRSKTVLMGQNTFESILGYLGKPLPNRKTVVVSNDPNYQIPEGVRLYHSLDTALEELKDEDLFICGGASIYQQTIDRVDTLYITHVRQIVNGDAFFPKIDPKKWKETKREDHNGFSFVCYKKIASSIRF